MLTHRYISHGSRALSNVHILDNTYDTYVKGRGMVR
jgi:hypothetical protein